MNAFTPSVALPDVPSPAPRFDERSGLRTSASRVMRGKAIAIRLLAGLTLLTAVTMCAPAQEPEARQPESTGAAPGSANLEAAVQSTTAEGPAVDSSPSQSAAGDSGEGSTTAPTAASSSASQVASWRPLAAMALGVFVVLALMIGLKAHAFIALILGALVISCFIPLDVVGFVKDPEPHVVRAETGAPVQIVTRVTSSLGGAVSGIGILIAMAAIIGKCMLVSGAADRIVRAMLSLLGEKRAPLAMMASGFVLSIPVFFDTVFYLLVPLARSLYRTTGKNYLLYLGAIAAGGAITHTLVPPTPGPLLVAETLNVNVGLVMLIGIAVGIPSAIAGLLVAVWLNKVMPVVMRPMVGSKTTEGEEFERLPSIGMALVPVLLPVLLISLETVFSAVIGDTPGPQLASLQRWLRLIGNPNLAMVIAALFAIYLCWKVQGHTLPQLAEHVDDALLSGGVIILITAAGGAFGGLLAMTEIQVVIESYFKGNSNGGLVVIALAYSLAAIIKVAQGSSTVAMIITSSLVGSIALPLSASGDLGFNMAYLVPVIGSGSLMGSWMNDSGFWVFAKMGVLTEGETLRSWTILLAVLSVTGFLVTLAMASVFPMVE